MEGITNQVAQPCAGCYPEQRRGSIDFLLSIKI